MQTDDGEGEVRGADFVTTHGNCQLEPTELTYAREKGFNPMRQVAKESGRDRIRNPRRARPAGKRKMNHVLRDKGARQGGL